MDRPLAAVRPVSKLVALALLLTALAPATALPEETAFEWQKRKVVLTYGVPRVGKHTLAELQVGSTWRLGSGGITTMTFDAPVITTEGVVAPGTYRVNLARPGAQNFALTVEGAGTWSGGTGDVTSPGTFAEAKKPNEKMEIVCAPAKDQPDPELRTVTFEIQFGAPVITVPLTIVGTQTLSAAKGFAVDAFKLPSEALEKRLKGGKSTPIVSLVRKAKPREGESARLNLLLGESDVTLLPAATPPTENRGFGAIPTPDKAQTNSGKVQWSDATPPSPHLKVEAITIEDNVLHATIVVGARRGEITVPTVKPKN